MTGALFELPDLHDADAEWMVWGYGMGAESTAGLVRTLEEPEFRPPELRDDLSNLIVLIAQTGDEWSSLIAQVEKHILPLLRARNVRLVEVARARPEDGGGTVVLQDTRQPHRLHADPDENHFYALSEEHRVNGVLPQRGGTRKCSLKAKGNPLDTWRSAQIGTAPYVHAIGFNAQEGSRIEGDKAITLGGLRRPIYPIHAVGWSRQQCVEYLRRRFGVTWHKSLCRQCCFVSRAGWPEQRERFVRLPEEAAKHLVDEFVAIALNKDAALFGPGDSLTDRLRADGAHEVLDLAHAHIQRTPWALYRVRRIYSGPGQAWRSVNVVHRGNRVNVEHLLADLAYRMGLSLRVEDEHPRLWLAERPPATYPAVEEFYVAAPAQVRDKARPAFLQRWSQHASRSLALREADAITTAAELALDPVLLALWKAAVGCPRTSADLDAYVAYLDRAAVVLTATALAHPGNAASPTARAQAAMLRGRARQLSAVATEEHDCVPALPRSVRAAQVNAASPGPNRAGDRPGGQPILPDRDSRDRTR